MINVLLLLKGYLGYSETFTYNILSNLTDVGIQPFLHVEEYDNLDRFPLHWSSYCYEPPSKWYQKIRETRHMQEHVLQICKKEKIDVIHANAANRAILAGTAVRRLGLPLVVHCRGADIYARSRNRKARHELTTMLPYVTRFVCVSRHLKVFLQNAYTVPDNNITVHYGGIDLDLFTMNPQSDTFKHRNVIMIGRFTEKKGFQYGIAAFVHALKALPDLTLTIVGKGRGLAQYEEEIASHGIQDRVTFVQPCDSKTVAGYLRSASIMLAPHVTAKNGDAEGIPNVIKEAMAVGTPVVSTIHGGIPEVIKHEYSGLLYEEKDIAGLAEGIVRFSTDYSLYCTCRTNARRIAEIEFDAKKQIKKLQKLYEDVVNESGGHYSTVHPAGSPG